MKEILIDLKIRGLQLNPKLPDASRRALIEMHTRWKTEFPESSLWLATSGTSSGQGAGSLVVLSERAIEVSASAVNRHLNATAQDRWGLALPLFHIGGLMVPIRALLAGASVSRFTSAWEPREFHRWLGDSRVTLLSLVPTQVFDLVKAGLRSPSGLRAVIVGGGALTEELFESARRLGWPVLSSYGMTETASQIATATPGGPGDSMRVLPHARVRLSDDGVIEVQSESLMSAKILSIDSILKFESGSWYRTSDRGELKNVDGTVEVRVHGRVEDVVKILGELVDLERVRKVLRAAIAETLPLRKNVPFQVVATPDERKTHDLVLRLLQPKMPSKLESSPAVSSALSEIEAQEILTKYNESVAPFERIQTVHRVPTIEGTWKQNLQ